MDHALPQEGPRRIPASAIWSLVLGILSIICLWVLGSIPAIILGAVALKKIGSVPEAFGGRGLALSGIITGVVGLVTWLVVLVLAASAMPAMNRALESAKLRADGSEIRMILIGCRAYAADHGGEYPPDLDALVPNYLESEELLNYRPLANGETGRFFYRPGLADTSFSHEILLLGPERVRGPGMQRVAGFAGGHVDFAHDPIPPEILRQFEQME